MSEIDTLTLTTAHAAGSYGVPIAVIGGQTYGPGDFVPEADMTAAALVRQWAGRFVGLWPGGPQYYDPQDMTPWLSDLGRRLGQLPECQRAPLIEAIERLVPRKASK